MAAAAAAASNQQIRPTLARDSRNITHVMITANSNVPSEKYGYPAFADDMWELWNELFASSESMTEVFGDPALVKVHDANGPHVEVGGQQRRLHFNIEIELRHQVASYNLRGLKHRLRKYLNANWTESRGWHVWLRLIDRKLSNYSNKEARRAANDAAAEEFADEIARLSLADGE